MSGNMVRRIAVAVVGIPVALGIVYQGGWLLAGLIAVFGVVGSAELYRMARTMHIRPAALWGGAASAAFPLVAYWEVTGAAPGVRWVSLGAALWLLLVTGTVTSREGPEGRPLEAMGVTVLGACYAGGLPAFLVLIRHGAPELTAWGGTALVFLPLVLTWVCDSLAMAGGHVFGGPKLAPVLSPNKTWAGAVSGTVGAVVLAPLYGRVVLVPLGIGIDVWLLPLLGLAVAVVGQSGDIAESLIKRQAGVKDSGRFFPGHGGVLDRFDSLYWVIPVAALLLAVFGAT